MVPMTANRMDVQVHLLERSCLAVEKMSGGAVALNN